MILSSSIETSCLKLKKTLQVDTVDLNAGQLCGTRNANDPDPNNPKPPDHPDISRVLTDWQRTNSPLWSYWGKLLGKRGGLRNYKLPSLRCENSIFFAYGLPDDETQSVCRYVSA